MTTRWLGGAGYDDRSPSHTRSFPPFRATLSPAVGTSSNWTIWSLLCVHWTDVGPGSRRSERRHLPNERTHRLGRAPPPSLWVLDRRSAG